VVAVCQQVLTHLLGDRTDRRFTELLSQTVTLHWLAQTFNDFGVSSIDDYVRIVELSNSGEYID